MRHPSSSLWHLIRHQVSLPSSPTNGVLELQAPLIAEHPRAIESSSKVNRLINPTYIRASFVSLVTSQASSFLLLWPAIAFDEVVDFLVDLVGLLWSDTELGGNLLEPGIDSVGPGLVLVESLGLGFVVEAFGLDPVGS